ncbi:MAG: phage baseplate assembly protein [Ruminococcus sp.]|nr:phage baseplate assembly protein [Ruminococcus sp.]
MWLTGYITKNSMSTKNAVKGNVSNAKSNRISVESSCEHKQIRTCTPYGMVSVPPVGESAVVLPLEDGELSLGVIAKSHNLAEGEVMLFSKGGASIVLKNNGKVLINGKEF